jgi:hypothetical protein
MTNILSLQELPGSEDEPSTAATSTASYFMCTSKE